MTTERPFILEVPFEEIVERSPDIRKAFEPTDGIVRCIDERTPGGIHAAGGGILVGSGSFEDQVAWLKSVNARGITRHEGCGAESAWAKQRGLSPEEAETELDQRAKMAASALCISYTRIDRASIEQFGPFDQHQTGVIYYDGTGRFNYSTAPNLPSGFIISRGKFSDKSYPLYEANFAADIAFGHHGLGEKWFRENNKKLTIVAIGTKDLSVDQLIEELQPIRATRSDLITIDSLDARAYL